MKFIKIYEDFSFPEYEGWKIDIRQGSHNTTKQHNIKELEKLKNLLFDKKLNPYFDLFNNEELELDLDADSFILIKDSAEEEDFDYIDMMKLNNFIRDYLVDTKIDILIGGFDGFNFQDYKSDADIKKYKLSLMKTDFNL